jgi:hypothetical protein
VTEPSTQERIAIVDLADDLQVRKQRIFKILKRLNIRPTQRRELSRGNQNVATVSAADAAAIRAEILKFSDAPVVGNSAFNGAAAVFYSDDVGFFYVIQLELRMTLDGSRLGSRWTWKDAFRSTGARHRFHST